MGRSPLGKTNVCPFARLTFILPTPVFTYMIRGVDLPARFFVVGEPGLRQCAANQIARRLPSDCQTARLATQDGDPLKRRGRRRLEAGGLSFQTPPASSSEEATITRYGGPEDGDGS